MFDRRILYGYLLLNLVMVLPMMAQVEPPSFSPSLAADAVELEQFERFAMELAGSTEGPIAHLGAQALAIVEARAVGDAEAFIGAKAIFDLRRARLSAEDGERVSKIFASVRQDAASSGFLSEAWAGSDEKGGLGLGFNGGCEAKIVCDSTTTISCECITPPQSHGDCYFSVIANGGLPGRVTCDCDGASVDSKRCPPPSTGCDPGACNRSCGWPGGSCTPRGCICH